MTVVTRYVNAGRSAGRILAPCPSGGFAATAKDVGPLVPTGDIAGVNATPLALHPFQSAGASELTLLAAPRAAPASPLARLPFGT